MQIINFINSNIVWGPAMLFFMIGCGIYLSLKLEFIQIRKFSYMMKNTIFSVKRKDKQKRPSSEISPFQAVATAMAGTIGTGSITGLATAIMAGGPGAVFWMWISAIFGMATKFCEIVLSVKYREKTKNGQWVGGPMYYIHNGLKSEWLAVLFSLCAMVACLGIGNMAQSNSIAVSLNSLFGIDAAFTGTILTLIAAGVILGGMRTIAAVNEKFVPFMAVFYAGCAAIVLFVNAAKIPGAFNLIFSEAFKIKAAAGGTAGYGIMRAMQYGLSRGIFSNEAGLGSAPIAHAAANTKEPVRQGLWGMFEVFFATMVICTLTALVIITSGLWQKNNLNGATLSIEAFNHSLPHIGAFGVMLAMVFFALSSIFGWAYYGEVCTGYLFDKSETAVFIYRCIFVGFVFFGAVGNLEFIWEISTMLNGLMAVPNLIGIIGLNSVVKNATKEYFR